MAERSLIVRDLQALAPPPLPVRPSIPIQRLWFMLTRGEPWHSLVVVPVGPEVGPCGIAYDLTRMACHDGPGRVLLVDALRSSPRRGAEPPTPELWPMIRRLLCFDVIELGDLPDEILDGLLQRADEWMRSVDELGAHRRRIVAVGPIVDEVKLLPLCRPNDRALLLLKLGETDCSRAKRVIELIGKDRIAGAVAVE